MYSVVLGDVMGVYCGAVLTRWCTALCIASMSAGTRAVWKQWGKQTSGRRQTRRDNVWRMEKKNKKLRETPLRGFTRERRSGWVCHLAQETDVQRWQINVQRQSGRWKGFSLLFWEPYTSSSVHSTGSPENAMGLLMQWQIKREAGLLMGRAIVHQIWMKGVFGGIQTLHSNRSVSAASWWPMSLLRMVKLHRSQHWAVRRDTHRIQRMHQRSDLLLSESALSQWCDAARNELSKVLEWRPIKVWQKCSFSCVSNWSRRRNYVKRIIFYLVNQYITYIQPSIFFPYLVHIVPFPHSNP